MTVTVDTPELTLRSLDATWNYARWEKLPDDGNRYEVINGVLYMTTAPSFFHQWVVKRFDRFVGTVAEELGLAIGIGSPVGLLMPGCDPVQPDYVLILKEHFDIINDRRIRGVPDLLVEVLSPGTIANDEEIKFNAYARAGVPEYVIIDPATRTLRHYRLEMPDNYGDPQIFHETDTVTFDCLSTIPLSIASLFAGAPDTTV